MRIRRLVRIVLLVLLPATSAWAQPKLVSPDSSRFRLDGYAEMQLRGMADDFHPNRAYLSQWDWVLNLEPELEIAPDGWGPFTNVSAFARIEFRYQCVWRGCGLSNSWRQFGDRSRRAPADNWANALTEVWAGGINLQEQGIPRRRVHGDRRDLLDITHVPRFERAFDAGVPRQTLVDALGPLADDVFTYKRFDGPRESLALPLGPWRPESKIRANGALGDSPSNVLSLPMRPMAESLYIPSSALTEARYDFGSFDQNFSQRELEWNLGGSQDEWFLRELYLDMEFLDGKLWVRAGKQNIVWGKTELFRTTDQFNPTDIGLASLPSLEESRIPLWSVRGIWSFYDVGPFEDMRLEVAANLDDFEPIDTGRCGEPYTVWVICGKSTGLWAHGATGSGLAGEVKPPDFWDDLSGLEVGARLEFRWSRFSFALTDFWGYDDVPAVELFNSFERRVDVKTGRPLNADGKPLTPENALDTSSGNRQAFDFGCVASKGFGQNALLALTGGSGQVPDVSERCIGDIVNLRDPITLSASLFGINLSLDAEPTNAIGALLAGQIGGNLLMEGAINGLESALLALLALNLPARLTPLNRDPFDGPSGGGLFGSDCAAGVLTGILCPIFNTSNLSYYLTDEQEALLGCGPFYRTDCDVHGLDFFNAEASVLLQAFPGFEYNPVATRYERGKLFYLPGSRGPGDLGYDPRFDGTPPKGFRSELEALSSNFAQAIGVLGIAEGDTECDLSDLQTCAVIRALVAFTGSQRPEIRAGGNGRYGRRDFSWHGGGEARIQYPKRNVLGFSLDFAEDWSKTSWGMEFTWINDGSFASNTSSNLLQEADIYNLTISVDRPTFINFLNANRTFLFNSQWFIRYVPGHDSSFDTNGPYSVLATFAAITGYFQDRLISSLVYVHDFPSASGGVVAQLTYRANEAFSISLGVLGFHGKPGTNRIPHHPIQLFDTQTNFNINSRFDGLSAISERDEVFMVLRYTF